MDKYRHVGEKTSSFVNLFWFRPCSVHAGSMKAHNLRNYIIRHSFNILLNTDGNHAQRSDDNNKVMEQYLANKLYYKLFPWRSLSSYSARLNAIRRFVTTHHLGIREYFLCIPAFTRIIIASMGILSTINVWKSPSAKLQCIVKSSDLIFNSVRTWKIDTSLDDAFPVLVYVLITSNPPRLVQNLLYIREFGINDELREGKNSFHLTMVESAAQYILQMDHNSLNDMSEEDWRHGIEYVEDLN